MHRTHAPRIPLTLVLAASFACGGTAWAQAPGDRTVATVQADALQAAPPAEPPSDAAPPSAPAAGPQASRSRIGDATTALLDLQRSAAVASPTDRPVNADVATRNYQRYLESFTHKVPEFFDATVGRSSSAGGGGGASSSR